jgi:hypothetical protein
LGGKDEAIRVLTNLQPLEYWFMDNEEWEEEGDDMS